MKTNKQELKNKMLNDEQAATVKEMIVSSMRNVYTDQGSLPGDGFDQAAGYVADKIIKNTQMALIQNNVYAKAVNESKPMKNNNKMKSSVTIKLMKNGKQVGKSIVKEVKTVKKNKKILTTKTKKNVRK